MSAPENVSHRQRTRLRAQSEVRATARHLLAQGGPNAVTLRAIGKEMGLVASGIYRYYASRDDLLAHLAGDLYADLLGHLQQAAATAPPGAQAVRRLAHAYRSWSLAHPQEFALLLYVPAPRAPWRSADHVPEAAPSTRQQFITTLLAAAGPLLSGDRHPEPPASAREELAVYRRLASDAANAPASAFTDSALYAAVTTWATVQGAVTLEALRHHPFPTADPEEVFRHTLDTALRALEGGAEPGSAEAERMGH